MRMGRRSSGNLMTYFRSKWSWKLILWKTTPPACDHIYLTVAVPYWWCVRFYDVQWGWWCVKQSNPQPPEVEPGTFLSSFSTSGSVKLDFASTCSQTIFKRAFGEKFWCCVKTFFYFLNCFTKRREKHEETHHKSFVTIWMPARE